MKKALIWILLVIVVVSASIIGTLAYLADSQAETNVMTMGKIDIKIVEYEREEIDKKGEDAVVQTFNDNKLLIPSIVPDGFDYSKPAAYVNWDNENNKIKPGTGYTSKIWEPAAITNEVDKRVFVKNTGKKTNAYVRLYFAFEAGQYASFGQFRNKIHLNINKRIGTGRGTRSLLRSKA